MQCLWSSLFDAVEPSCSVAKGGIQRSGEHLCYCLFYALLNIAACGHARHMQREHFTARVQYQCHSFLYALVYTAACSPARHMQKEHSTVQVQHLRCSLFCSVPLKHCSINLLYMKGGAIPVLRFVLHCWEGCQDLLQPQSRHQSGTAATPEPPPLPPTHFCSIESCFLMM